jgi:hypothetical protein
MIKRVKVCVVEKGKVNRAKEREWINDVEVRREDLKCEDSGMLSKIR